MLQLRKMDDIENETSPRASLGQMASLGDLYDARTDNFTGSSIFNKELPKEAISIRDNVSTEVSLIKKDTFVERLSKLDVEPEVQVSLLSGLSTPEGSGLYLNHKKTSANSVKASFLYNIKTKDEFVDISHQDLDDVFAQNIIESAEATHVVVGISWGANTVISCEYLNTDNRDAKTNEDGLTSQLTKMSTAILENTTVDFTAGDLNTGLKLDIQIFGDLLPPSYEMPKTFEATLTLLRQLPELVTTSSENGRGKPLTYHLMPLSELKLFLSLSTDNDITISPLGDESLEQVVEAFEKIANLKQEVEDFLKDVGNYQACVSPADIVKINELKNELATMETEFRTNLAKTLRDIRTGELEEAELEKLIEESESETAPSFKTLTNQLNTWGAIRSKIAFAKSLGPHGLYIGHGNFLDKEILKNDMFKIYVLYFQEAAKSSEAEAWRSNRDLFFQELEEDKANCKYFAVDCDIQKQLWPKQGISIEVYEQGKLRTHHFLKDHMAVAQSTVPMSLNQNKPDTCHKLSIPCAGPNCSKTAEQSWMCPTCKSQIEYGFDTFFYCECGRALANSYEYKCPDGQHGPGFVKYEDRKLKLTLSKIKPPKQLNILIMGKTGVGKSTWINGFINFLNFETLADAEQHEELLTLVPTKFTITDDNFNQITVSTGEDPNENQKTGQSATQSSKVYSFSIGDTLIRLIDTPGIGDSRGVTQDKLNFQNILSTVARFDEIHGICIFMKPNDSRLTVMFRFCVNELLTYLHRDASRNIMFCFTNSRGTFYRPGDTLPALQSLLKKNKSVEIPLGKATVYCYDSEAFRFLAAVKNKSNPVKFRDEEREDYANSWINSRKETKRMFQYIKSLKAHKIDHTLKLNHARDIIVKLTRPLADISAVIQSNIKIIDDHLAELSKTNESIVDLRKRSTYAVKSLQITKVQNPKTVCTNIACKVLYGPDEPIKYKICHDPCGLTGVTHDVIGHELLMTCDAIQPNGLCRRSNCGHNYREHMHIYYESQEIMKHVEDKDITKLLNSKLSDKDKKQGMIDDAKQKIKEMKDELKQIKDGSVQFACFLNHNSIIPYNDAMIAYLNHLIKEEKDKVTQGGDKTNLNNLQKYSNEYQAEIDTLKNEMEKSSSTRDDVLSPLAIEQVVDKLKNLKHHGKDLVEALKNVNEHQVDTRVVYRSVDIRPKKKSNKKGFRHFLFG